MIDISKLNINKVLKGCLTQLQLELNIIKNEELKKIQSERLDVCNNCKLNVDGICFRDTDNIWQKDSDFTPEQLMKKKTVYDKLDKRLKLGCGCNILCKTVILEEECPAHKWLKYEPLKKENG